MEIVCRQEDFAFAVRTVSHALGGRTPMPVLGGIRVHGATQQLEFTATDLERAITCRVPAQVKSGGTWVLPGGVLTPLVGRLPGSEQVQLVEKDGRVRLTCGPAWFELPTMAADEFPDTATPGPQPLCRFATPTLLECIGQTAFAALRPSETTRLALTGVDIVLKDGSAKFAATNGYRLAIKRVPVEGLPLGYEGTLLVDAGVLNDLHRVLSGLEAAEVQVFSDGRQAHFLAGSVLFSCRLIQEQFPDFERVIPKDNDVGLYLPREEFLEALRRMEITAAEESGAVTLEVPASKDQLEVSSDSKDRGAGHEVLPLAKAAPKPIKIAFKAEYLIDALRRMGSSQVALWLAASDRAGLIEPAGEIASGDEGFLYVCMPVRLL